MVMLIKTLTLTVARVIEKLSSGLKLCFDLFVGICQTQDIGELRLKVNIRKNIKQI